MGAIEEVKRGRPPGTTESIESLAKKELQQTIKTIERLRKTIEEQAEIVSDEVKLLPRNAGAMKDRMEMTSFLDNLRDGLLRSVPQLAKIVQADPAKASENDGVDAGMREMLSQISGDVIV